MFVWDFVRINKHNIVSGDESGWKFLEIFSVF